MFFFYVILAIILILVILIIFTTIEIHIENLRVEIPKKNKRNLNSKCKITVKFYILKKIKYLKLDITKNKIEKKLMKKNIERLKEKIEKDKNKFDIRLLSDLGKLAIKFKKIDLKINFGLDDAAANAIMVGVLASGISVIIGYLTTKKVIEQNHWKIMPIYQNKNVLNIDLNCIISFKVIHIIYIIFKKSYQKSPSPKEKNGRKEEKICQNIQ